MDHDSDAVCHTHKKLATYFCIHPMCNKLRPLCKKCFVKHEQYHAQFKMQGEPEPKNIFIPIKQIKQEVRQELNQIKETLESLQNKVFNEINLTIDPETNITPIINELEEIQKNINEEMDEFIKKLKESFEKPIKKKIYDQYSEIQQKQQAIQQMLTDCDSIDTIKKAVLSDLAYQTQIQKARINEIILQRKSLKFRGRIDDDVALRFQGAFKRELDNLIKFDIDEEEEEYEVQQKIKPLQPYQIMIEQSYFPKQIIVPQYLQGSLNNASCMPEFQDISNDPTRTILPFGNSQNVFQNLYNCLHFLEINTKKLHIYDIEGCEHHVIDVTSDFDFYPEHKSILGPDGNLYIIGGYDENIDEQNEDQYKSIYTINPFSGNGRLTRENMQLDTIRKHFGICVSKSCIFIIGGFNYLDGQLRKCEKIIFDQKKIEEQEFHLQKSRLNQSCIQESKMSSKEVQFDKKLHPMNLLHRKCSHPTVACFRDKYIFKFGGIIHDSKLIDSQKGSRTLSNFVEIYQIDNDTWDYVDISQENSFRQFYSGAALQINPNYILIFGGKDFDGRLINNSYLLKVTEEIQEGIQDDNNKNLNLELDTSSSEVPEKGYFRENPIIIDKTIYTRIQLDPQQSPPQYDQGECEIYSFKANQWKKILIIN